MATARDSTSVRELLGSCGVAIPPDRVYGQQQSKLGALTEIGAREDARAGSIFFIDDSLSNVVAARDAGYTAAWALWGYSAPEHDKEASRLGVPRLTLADLPSTALSAAGRWPLAAAAWPQQPGRIAAAGEPATVDGGAG